MCNSPIILLLLLLLLYVCDTPADRHPKKKNTHARVKCFYLTEHVRTYNKLHSMQ